MNTIVGLFVLIVSVVAVQSSHDGDMHKENFEKELKMCPNLRKDLALFGSCEGPDGKTTDTVMSDHQVEASRACKEHKDYRCYKICQMEKMGIVDASGKLDEMKFMEHYEHKMADHKEVSKNYIKEITECTKDNGKPAMLSTKDCAKNDAHLKCAIAAHYKHCHPKDKNIPMVPTMVTM